MEFGIKELAVSMADSMSWAVRNCGIWEEHACSAPRIKCSLNSPV